jgi:hypothetical protein
MGVMTGFLKLDNTRLYDVEKPGKEKSGAILF